MEAVLVSAATGALNAFLGKLATLLGDEYKRLTGVRGEIRFLRTELASMHAFLLKMSEEEDPDEQDKVWMTAVRELSYDMEDSIDDFMQRVNDKDAKPDGFMEKIKHSLGKLGKMKTHRRIGKEIQDLKQQIIEVGERNARYKTREAFSKTINATVDPRALAIFEHASKLIGIEEPKAEIIKLLTEEDGVTSTHQQQQQLKVVSIVGSGGMGKTTLANQVYQQLKEQFECQAFLSVSRNPDMIKILRTILSEVAKKDYNSTEAMDEQQLLSKISDFLVDKRLFQLRYLNIRNTIVSELPEQIGRLQCLEMLDLRYTSVRELPATTVNLKKLVHLLTGYSVKFPDGIAKMRALEVLKHVSVWEQPLNFPQQLGQLKNLRKLNLDFERYHATGDISGVEEECEKAIASSLLDLGTHQNLHCLSILDAYSFLQQGPSCPVPVSLQELTIWRSAVPWVPNWVGSLVNLQVLCLEVEGVGQEDLCILGALPTLRFLFLIGKAESKGNLRVSGEVGFPCLREFCYDMENCAMDLKFASGSMPKLEKLMIEFDSAKTESLTSGAFDFGIENLPCLVTVKCIAFGESARGRKGSHEDSSQHTSQPPYSTL